jgi:exportin-5
MFLVLLILEVLMSLPHIKQEDLVAFEDALSKTTSPKEQRQHIRSLLILATGNQLKALAAQKTTNLITNVTGSIHFDLIYF